MRSHCDLSGRGVYCAWPSVVRAPNGDILVVFTATEEHLGPDGRILMVRSTDNGHTWGSPDTLFDTPIDDRESGFTRHRMARSLHTSGPRSTRGSSMRPSLHGRTARMSLLAGWSCVDALRYQEQDPQRGAWERRSTDNGHSWSAPVRGRDAVHGGIQLKDGSLLIASYREDIPLIGVYRSTGTQRTAMTGSQRSLASSRQSGLWRAAYCTAPGRADHHDDPRDGDAVQ